MKSHKTIILNWQGPYKFEELSKFTHLENGLYLATGKLKHKQITEIQYCGITEGSLAKRIANHHKVDQINRKQRFWLAQVQYPKRATRNILELAETIIIYFWQPELNERKKVGDPMPVTVINQWLKKDGTPRYIQHTLCKDLDDVLSWDGELWRTGNLGVWEN
jgi:hypothetical protein